MVHAQKVLSPKDVVEEFPCLTTSEAVLANWRSQGVGPKYYRVTPRKIVYDRADVEAFLLREPVLTKDSAERPAAAATGE